MRHLATLAAGVTLATAATLPAQETTPPEAAVPAAAAPDAAGADALSPDALPLEQIIERMLERAERQDENESELRYESRIVSTSDRLDEEGAVTETETREYRRYPLEGELYEELILRNGQPLDAGQQRDEREKRAEFIRDARERAREGGGRAETNDEREVRLGPELLGRYTASIAGVETVGGEPCWAIAFKPREGRLPENTRMDRALNRSSGTMYVAQSDYGLARVEFTMDQPVRYLLGLATLNEAVGSLEFERVAPDVWLPKLYNFRMELRIFFSTRRQQVVREWVERQLLDPEPAL